LPYWLQGDAGDGVAFAQAATLQKGVADASRAPKRIGDADYLGPMNYAYHFDAGKLAAVLAAQAKTLGVRHVLATIEHVEQRDDGAIAALVTREGMRLEADLFIDCTGFRAALIGRALGSRVKRLDDVLFVDRALAVQVPYAQADQPIASYTI